MIRINSVTHVLGGAIGYAFLRTAAPFIGQKSMLLGSLLMLGAFAWVMALLVIAVKRRQRTPSQATGEFMLAVGLGYFASGLATTPLRVQLDPTQTLSAMWPIMLFGTVVGMVGVGLVAAVVISIARRNDQKQPSVTRRHYEELKSTATPSSLVE